MANLNNYNDIIINNDLKLIDFFKKDSRQLITYECKNHGVITQRLDTFNGCRFCNREITKLKISKANKHSYETVVDYVNDNSTAEFMSKSYTKQSKDYWFKCECGNGFRTSLNSFKQKNKRVCSICAEKIRVSKRQNTEDEIKKYVEKMSDLEYLRYFRNNENGKLYVVLRCACGNEVITIKSNLKHFKIKECEECRIKSSAIARRLSIDEVKNNLKKLNLTLLSTEYSGQKSKVNVKCNNCGYEFKDTYISVLKRLRVCSNCSSHLSKGARKIYYFLKEASIDFETEKTFKECKSIKRLRFDFYLPNYNLLIEYDGEFHYINRSITLVGMPNYFNGKKRDYIKNAYCRKNKYKLIRIPFWEVETINKYLKYLLKI